MPFLETTTFTDSDNPHHLLSAFCSCDWPNILNNSYAADTFHITSALTLNTVVTLKMQTGRSSETSVHLATTSCRNPNEGHLLKSNKKMKRNVTEKIWWIWQKKQGNAPHHIIMNSFEIVLPTSLYIDIQGLCTVPRYHVAIMCEVPSSHFLQKCIRTLQYVVVICDTVRIKNVKHAND